MKLYYEACASLQQVPADTIGGPVTIEMIIQVIE